MVKSFLSRTMSCAALWAMLVNYGLGQTANISRPRASQPFASVTGMVLDPSDAFMVGASVSLGPGHRELWQTKTGAKGEFQFGEVAPGHYELRVGHPGFKVQRTRLDVGAGKSSPLRIVLSIADLEASIKVDDSEDRLSVAAGENADVVRLGPRQLEGLPMMDRDVIGALSRLLDPASMGSGGPSVIVDGLPSSELHIPLSEIEEIRINDNSYTAEFARSGRGRIDI